MKQIIYNIRNNGLADKIEVNHYLAAAPRFHAPSIVIDITDLEIALAQQLYDEEILDHTNTYYYTNAYEYCLSRGANIFDHTIYWGGLINYGWITNTYNQLVFYG